MSWTVAQITTLFRDLTGRKSTDQISDANILIEINHYYQHVFPLEANITEFKGWYTFDTVDGTGYQDLPDTVISVGSPAYCNDDEVNLWSDEKRFYEEYTHDYDTENVPTDILLFDRRLILRPIPDDAYEVRLRQRSSIPDALVTGDIDNAIYGLAIGYGSAIMYLKNQGEKDIAEEHADIYAEHIGNVRMFVLRQNLIGKRPPGGRF